MPVFVSHRDYPKKEAKVYALLDDASDTTFVTTKVQQALGIEGVETELTLSTMSGKEVISVSRIDGLVAERHDRRAKVDLPKTYAKESIPCRGNQIPTPEMADKWPHLKKMKDKILKLDDSIEIVLASSLVAIFRRRSNLKKSSQAKVKIPTQYVNCSDGVLLDPSLAHSPLNLR